MNMEQLLEWCEDNKLTGILGTKTIGNAGKLSRMYRMIERGLLPPTIRVGKSEGRFPNPERVKTRIRLFESLLKSRAYTQQAVDQVIAMDGVWGEAEVQKEVWED